MRVKKREGGLRVRWIFTEVGGKVGWLVGSLEFEVGGGLVDGNVLSWTSWLLVKSHDILSADGSIRLVVEPLNTSQLQGIRGMGGHGAIILGGQIKFNCNERDHPEQKGGKLLPYSLCIRWGNTRDTLL